MIVKIGVILTVIFRRMVFAIIIITLKVLYESTLKPYYIRIQSRNVMPLTFGLQLRYHVISVLY